MTIRVPDGIDPELARTAQLQPDLDYADPRRARAGLARATKISRYARPAQDESALAIADRLIPARDGSPDIPVRIYGRSGPARRSPALVFLHGGAFVAGDLELEHVRCVQLADRTGAVVVSVDYRLAPEHPFPAGVQDCYDATVWTASHADELGIDSALLAVGGISAGGALATAVAMMARDLAGPPLILEMLLYPVIDDAMATVSMRTFFDTPGWNQPNSVHMWRHYLGADGGEVSPYAAPTRATNLSDLPPAYVLTAEFDPLRDEGIDYAVRLLTAGIPTELHQFRGTFHGFDAAAPVAACSVRALDEQCAVLRRAFEQSRPPTGVDRT